MPVSSHVVGPWTLVWRIWWYAWTSLWHTTWQRPGWTGRPSTSSRVSARPDKTVLLAANPIPGTSGVPRWLLTYELVEWRGLMQKPSGASSGLSGNEPVGDGVETSNGKAARGQTRGNGIISI